MQRQEEALKLSLSPQNKNTQNLPPKGSKCRNCEAYIKNQQVLQQQVADREQTILSLQGDLQCLREFI
jgi:bacterioferritin (cytochrome b1)